MLHLSSEKAKFRVFFYLQSFVSRFWFTDEFALLLLPREAANILFLKENSFFPSLLDTLLVNLVLKYLNQFLSFILSPSNCIDEHSLELCYVF